MAAPGNDSVAHADFLGFGPGSKAGQKGLGKRKRVNKNKKKNWLRHSDVKDVEEFLDDVRLQERTAGGLLQDKADDSLFFVDTAKPKKKAAKLKKKDAPLHIDLILQSDSKIPPPKDIASHQVPNGRKLKRKQELQAQLEKRGILSRSEKLLQARLNKSNSKAKAQANNNPGRSFYDIWGEKNPLDSEHQGKDSWYLEQTKKSRVKHPDRLNTKPSEIPAIETVGSGSSYNPSFQSHQALLLQAHEVELKKLKEEEKIERQLKFPTAADAPTQESQFQELCEGLVEESEEMTAVDEGSEEQGTGPGLRRERKTERQRKKEKEARFLRAKLQADKIKKQRTQSLFQLRSIQTALAKREGELARRKAVRAENRKKEALQPRRLGRLKYKEPEIDVLLSDELPESLRKLKPEGNIAMDRFKSFQKRNIIEPRERAKFHRKLKVKYVEKRAFREVTL